MERLEHWILDLRRKLRVDDNSKSLLCGQKALGIAKNHKR